jgi:ribosomal protein S18 acetylase RimI-like enzyme
MLNEKLQKKKRLALRRPRAERNPYIRIAIAPHNPNGSAVRMLASGRGSLHRALGDIDSRARLFSPGLRWQQVIVATHRGRAVGFAAFKCHGRGGPYAPKLGDFLSVYGVGGLWRYLAFWVAEGRDIRSEFYLYGIKISPRYRGQGLARRLLDAAAAEARRRGASHVELEVLDRHHKAELVYAHYGYTVYRRRRLGWLSRVLGFGTITTMRLPLD